MLRRMLHISIKSMVIYCYIQARMDVMYYIKDERYSSLKETFVSAFKYIVKVVRNINLDSVLRLFVADVERMLLRNIYL